MPILEVGALRSHFELRGVEVPVALGDWCQAPVIPSTIAPVETVVIPCDLRVVPVVLLVGAVEMCFNRIFTQVQDCYLPLENNFL